MAHVHGRHRLERCAHAFPRVAVALEPRRRARVELAANAFHEPDHQLVASAEIDVERRTGQGRSRHHVVHGEIAKRPLAKQRLGGVEDLALGRLGGAATALGGPRRGLACAHE